MSEVDTKTEELETTETAQPAETEQKKTRKHDLRYYERRIDNNKITLDELAEYDERIKEELQKSQERTAALTAKQSKVKRQHEKIKQANTDKLAKKLGKKIVDIMGMSTTVEEVAALAHIRVDYDNLVTARNNLTDAVKSLFQMLQDVTLNSGLTALDFVNGYTDGETVAAICEMIDFTYAPSARMREAMEKQKRETDTTEE